MLSYRRALSRKWPMRAARAFTLFCASPGCKSRVRYCKGKGDFHIVAKSSDPKHSNGCEARPRMTVKLLRVAENPVLAEVLAAGGPKPTLKMLANDLTHKGCAGRPSVSTIRRATKLHDEHVQEDSVMRYSALPDYLGRFTEANPGPAVARQYACSRMVSAC